METLHCFLKYFLEVFTHQIQMVGFFYYCCQELEDIQLTMLKKWTLKTHKYRWVHSTDKPGSVPASMTWSYDTHAELSW